MGFPGVPGSKPSQLLHGRDFLFYYLTISVRFLVVHLIMNKMVYA